MAIEYWNLYLDRTLVAPPWPWAHRSWEDLAAGDVERLPHSVDDFTRAAPSDGFDVLVPAGLPRQWSSAASRLAVYHDPDRIYVFIHAVRPTPLPQLRDLLGQEDFGCAFQLDGIERGRYFGMNQNGEAIGTGRVFDPTLQREQDLTGPLWENYSKNPWGDVGGYTARVITTADGIAATWAIDRAAIQSGLRDNRIRFTASRRCYATNELTAWAASILWEPRVVEMGTLVLVDEIAPAALPSVRRVDVRYDTASETGRFAVQWCDLWDGARLAALRDQGYADFLTKCAVTLNGQEHIAPIGATVEAEFAIADGWNRLEIQSGFVAPVVVNFMKLSGNRVAPPPMRRSAGIDAAAIGDRIASTNHSPWPSRDELIDAFARWHDATEKSYLGNGIWGHPLTHEAGGGQKQNISHNGAFMMTPYALACLHLDRRAVYVERVRELCERALTMQKPAGWFPELAIDPEGTRAFAGGGFDTGAAGEALVLGYRVLGDERYLRAARRIVDAYSLYRHEVNMNYAAFAVWHLTELHGVAPEARVLDLAVYYTRHNAARAIDLSGAQDGHNYYSTYGGITLKGMAKLLAVLPAEHEYHATLRHQALRMVNQMLWRQQVDGRFAERNRKYVGFWSLEPATGLLDLAQALGEPVAAELRPGILAAYAAQRGGPLGAVVARMARNGGGVA